MNDNPYQSNSLTTSPAEKTDLMTARTVGFVLLVGVTGAICGSLLGGTAGFLAPAYYNELFNSQGDPSFNAVRLGVGLGLFQGFGGGVGLGAFLAVAQAWLRSRE